LSDAALPTTNIVAGEQLRGLNRWSEIAGRDAGETCLVYGGDEDCRREGRSVLS
jgi:hypothetical protein